MQVDEQWSVPRQHRLTSPAPTPEETMSFLMRRSDLTVGHPHFILGDAFVALGLLYNYCCPRHSTRDGVASTRLLQLSSLRHLG